MAKSQELDRRGFFVAVLTALVGAKTWRKWFPYYKIEWPVVSRQWACGGYVKESMQAHWLAFRPCPIWPAKLMPILKVERLCIDGKEVPPRNFTYQVGSNPPWPSPTVTNS